MNASLKFARHTGAVTSIRPIAPAVPGSAARARATEKFAVADRPAAAAPLAGPEAVCWPGLLGLQNEAEHPDTTGRRRGRLLLASLAALQRGLLDGGDQDALVQLRHEIEGLPEPADPGLRDTLASIVLRVRVELARRGID